MAQCHRHYCSTTTIEQAIGNPMVLTRNPAEPLNPPPLCSTPLFAAITVASASVAIPTTFITRSHQEFMEAF